MSRAAAMEQILHRAAQTDAAACWVLRGGVLAQRWFHPYPRPANDVDFLALYDFDQTRTDALVQGLGLPMAAPSEVIWEEFDPPGLRYQLQIGDECVQVDIGFGDPLPEPPAWEDIATHWGTARLQVASPEVGLAWKLHGLFEFEDGQWQAKDLHDIVLIIQHTPLRPDRITPAIRMAFESKDTPLFDIDRLLSAELGQSRSSRRSWQSLSQKRPDVPPMADAIAIAIDTIGPYVEAMHPPLHHPTGDPFPIIAHIQDVLPAIAGASMFERRTQDDWIQLDSTRRSPRILPNPGTAANARIQTHRQLRRECRGLVFDPSGVLIARPYHWFAPRDEQDDPHPLVLEKLDGTMLFPVMLPSGLRLLGRQGRSPRSAAAEAFAHADSGRHHALWAMWIADGWTPILEWCSPAHRIIVAQPRARLVLTAIRNHRDGRYLPYADLVHTAQDHHVEVVASHGRLTSLAQLTDDIQAATGREGVVLRSDNGRMHVLKSAQYQRLWHARNSDDIDDVIWSVIVHDEAPLLAGVLPPERARTLRGMVQRYQQACQRRCEQLHAEAASLIDAGVTPAMLAGMVEHRPPIERNLLFTALAGHSIEDRLKLLCMRRVGSPKLWRLTCDWLNL